MFDIIDGSCRQLMCVGGRFRYFRAAAAPDVKHMFGRRIN